MVGTYIDFCAEKQENRRTNYFDKHLYVDLHMTHKCSKHYLGKYWASMCIHRQVWVGMGLTQKCGKDDLEKYG